MIDFTMVGKCIICGGVLTLLRVAWYYGEWMRYERMETRLRMEAHKVDGAIALELVKCAAKNPEAAAILRERIHGWKVVPDFPERRAYLHMTGELENTKSDAATEQPPTS